MPYTHLMSLIGLFALAVLLPRQDAPADHGKAWIGTPAKSEIVKNEDGADVDLSKQFGKRPVVMVFYRGVW